MTSKTVLSFLLFGAFYLGLFALEIEFPQLSSAPVMDGKGNDPAWKELSWHSGFVLVGTNTKPDAATSFKAGTFGDFIYFLIRAEEPDTTVLKKSRQKRDDLVFFDDAVEVMIDAENAKENFSHIIVNSLGTVFDSYYRQGGMVASPSWNFIRAQTAVFVAKDYFQAEIALPLAELGFLKGDGRIRFNVARQRHGKMREISSFSPTKGSLQIPATFADGVIRMPGLDAYAYRLSSPYDLEIKDGKEISGKIQLSNQTGKNRFVEFIINGQPRIKRFLNANLSTDVTFVLPYESKVPLLVEVREKGKLRLCKSFVVEQDYQPIRLSLISPAYRSNIYSDENISAIAGTVKICSSACSGKNIEIFLSDSAGQVISHGKAAADGTFSLPATDLKEGVYKLTVRCGKDEFSRIIRKLPYCPGEVRFNQYGVMLVDGKPFTPYGWFRLNLVDGSKDGYNVVAYYNAPWQSDEELKEYLDQAHRHGLKVLTYCYPRGSMMTNSAYRKILSEADAKLIRSRVEKFSRHPALLAWYLADEPEYEPWLRARLEKVEEICRTADPWHPTCIANNSIDGVHKYRFIGDISLADYYPGFLEGGDSASPIGRYGELLAASRKTDNRAQWGVPQGFTWNAYGSKGHRIPDYDELRNMHYQTLLNGHTGIIWYSHELNYSEPALHIHVKKLLDEMKLFHALWQNPQKRKELVLTSNLIAASYHDVNQHDFVIAVNLMPKDQEISLQAPSATPFYIAGEKGKSVSVQNGMIRDRLGRYRTRVYTTDATLASAFTAQAEIDAVSSAEKALHRPGNLAYYRASGIKLTSSLMTDPRIPLYQLCDGAYSSIHVFDRYKDKRCEVTLIFPKKIKFARLELYGRKIRSFQVFTPAGKFGEYHAGNSEFGRVQKTVPVETDRITVSSFDGFGISEIEIYSNAVQ